MNEIQPTMTDRDVMDFVASGYVLLEGVVPDEVNERYNTLPDKEQWEELIQTREFVHGVFLNPKVAGVARSLLGKNFLAPTSAHHHYREEPFDGQTWHSDGLTETGVGVTHLQCYYYPQEVTLEDGPTMILPGSAFRFVDREAIAHYGDIAGQISLTVPAGTVVMGHYGIWHKAGPKLSTRPRGMIKFSYYRVAEPTRDWIIDSEEIPDYEDPPKQPYVSYVEHYRERIRCRRTWEWICGIDSKRDQGEWGTDGKVASQARPVSEIVS